MTDTPTRAQRFAAVVVPAAERAGYTGRGAGARLARDSGMSESSVSRMLNGQAVPEMVFWAPLAKVLDIELIDLLTAMGIPRDALRALSETDRSQVGSRSLSPEEMATRVGISDPVGVEMLIATIERLKRFEEHNDQPGDERGGTAAQM
ncbi:multiprotein-bridging factor 1 family protein [Streptomyces sp. NPDC014623]|uniref:helix-turn-helix domain-containing protein n=1 Tax=Streptomyces sp. NPDC014623 TaxID=3364875 RepID=UPI003702A53E